MHASRFEVRVVDSAEMAEERRRALDLDRDTASRLGQEAVRFIEQGWYPASAQDTRRPSGAATVMRTIPSSRAQRSSRETVDRETPRSPAIMSMVWSCR